MKINDAVKMRTEKRIRRYAETHFVGRYTRLDIRFRGHFCYVDAYTEPELPDPDWPPPDWPESREEYLERLRGLPIHLFRLDYLGDEERWGFAFYTYAHEKYEKSFLPTGNFLGTPEEAFHTVAGLYL
jgi:hypothetical protein